MSDLSSSKQLDCIFLFEVCYFSEILDSVLFMLITIMICRCAGKECGGVMEDALMAVSTLIEGYYFSGNLFKE